MPPWAFPTGHACADAGGHFTLTGERLAVRTRAGDAVEDRRGSCPGARLGHLAHEIGTSEHSAIWIAWAPSKTGGRLVTIDIDG
jgi:hypothetical protein